MKKRQEGDKMSGVREGAQVANKSDGRIGAREGMATTVFTVESLGLKSTYMGPTKKKGKGKQGTYRRAATTVLAGEATYDVERRVRDARRALCSDPPAFDEMRCADFDLTRGAVTLMPARPKWDYELKRGKLHSRERKAFVRWIAGVKARLREEGKGYAPAFEQNIEVWRQLWRVLERADVAVLVVDARHPLLHTPPALYAHVARRLRKPLVLVLNKVDAIPRMAAEEWGRHLLAALPGVDEVIGFTSKDGGGGAGGQKEVRKRIGIPAEGTSGGAREKVSRRERALDSKLADTDLLLLSDDDDEEVDPYASESDTEAPGDETVDGVEAGPWKLRVGTNALLRVCNQLAAKGKRVAVRKAEAALEAAAAAAEDAAEELEAKAALKDQPREEYGDNEHGDDDDDGHDDEVVAAALQAEEEEATAAKDGRVMIGLVGHPNVGKSSMVNYILGRKAVSVKATPGHTKTLQTLILDDDTCLCDSPGLVFPRVDIGLAEQIIGGLVPLPIVREPYSAVRWLAELKERTGTRWSAMAADTSMSHQDKALAHALAATVDKALKIPAVAEFDPEILELTGAEDVLNETLPWSPMSMLHQYAKVRGFAHRGGDPDEHAAGQTVLALVLEGRLPYAVPPPHGDPVDGVHVGADGEPVSKAFDKYADPDAVGPDVSDEELPVGDGEETDDDEEALINPFRLLGIDAEGESQYGSGDIDDSGAGRFKMKGLDGKGAAASYFGRGGGGGGGMASKFLTEDDLKESKRGTRVKKGR